MFNKDRKVNWNVLQFRQIYLFAHRPQGKANYFQLLPCLPHNALWNVLSGQLFTWFCCAMHNVFCSSEHKHILWMAGSFGAFSSNIFLGGKKLMQQQFSYVGTDKKPELFLIGLYLFLFFPFFLSFFYSLI